MTVDIERQRVRPRPPGRRRERAFTLLELVVTVVIIGVITGVSAGMIAPQISYFRGRTSTEQVAAMMKYAQYLARSTHIALEDRAIGVRPPGTNPQPSFGVVILPPQAGFTQGFSLLVWRQDDLRTDIRMPLPPLSVGGLTALQRSSLVELPFETVITRQAGDAPIPLPGTRIAFGPDGRLDPANSDLVNLVEYNPLANPDFRAFTFDIQNPSVGFTQVRVHLDGTVEQSAHGPTGTAPRTQGGSLTW